jgi:hypothetical protein
MLFLFGSIATNTPLSKWITTSFVPSQIKLYVNIKLSIHLCGGEDRYAKEFPPTIIEKCLGSSRQKTKDKATQLLLLIMEIDVLEPVIVCEPWIHSRCRNNNT